MISRASMTESSANSNNDTEVQIRTYRPTDQKAVNRLYREGLLAGQIPENDTGADIENIHEAYLDTDRAHFWVADHDGQVVGMVGVAEDEPNVAEVRRLRVDPECQRHRIAEKLMETALSFCRHHGYLKVRLDTRLERGQATELFDRFAFQHHRSRAVPGKELLEFYLDLYREPKHDNHDD